MGTWVLAAAFFTGPVLCLAAMAALVSDPQFERIARARTRLRGRWARRRGTTRRRRPVVPSRTSPATPAASAGSSSTRTTVAAPPGSARSAGPTTTCWPRAARRSGLAELLGVLPDGPELDAERRRVEVVLVGAGMVLESTPSEEPRPDRIAA